MAKRTCGIYAAKKQIDYGRKCPKCKIKLKTWKKCPICDDVSISIAEIREAFEVKL